MEKRIWIYLLISIAAMTAVPILHAASVAASQGGVDALSVYNLQIAPNPIYAGDNVTISLQLYDSYTYTLNNINLELEGSYPILNVSPSSPYLLSSAGPGFYGGSTSYFTYVIHIPKNTPSGNYSLNLVATYQTTQTTSGVSTTVTGSSIMPINFYVHGNPHIKVNPSAQDMVPGESSQVIFSLVNSGYGKARNVTVSLENTSDFSVIGSKNFFVGIIPAEGSGVVTATYLANSRIANGTYYLPLLVSYQSSEGTEYNQSINQTINVKIQNPDLVASIVAANPSTLYSGYNQSLQISVQNIGYGTAKNVSLILAPKGGISLLSSLNNFFIGSISPGQSVTESVLVAASNYTGGSAGLTAEMNYYSTNYESAFSKEQDLNISIAPSATFEIENSTYHLIPGETAVPINFTITNTGTTTAEGLQLNFQSTYPITPVSGSGYIQDLAPGQTKEVTFIVSVDSRGTPGTYPVTVYETWKQPDGAAQQTYSGSSSYFADVSSGTSSGISAYENYIIAIIVVVVIAVVVYRRFLKGDSQKKKTPKAL